MRISKLLAVIVLWGLLGAVNAQSAQPTQEQLLAASLSIKDFEALKIAGEWSEGSPDFSVWTFEKNLDPGFLRNVMAQVLAWPAENKTSVDSYLNLFSDTASAAAGYKRRLDSDIDFLGPVIPGPAIGDESRFHFLPGTADAGAQLSIRFRHGKYLLKIESVSSVKTLDRASLEALARRMLSRLDRLDAGRLDAPALPRLAAALPQGDGMLKPVLGTAAGPSGWWVWHMDGGKLEPSESLHSLLQDGVGKRQSVLRTYGLSNIPAHCATVGIIPFRNKAAARKYLDADRTSGKTIDKDFIIQSPASGSLPTQWQGTFMVGRHVVEIGCFADMDGSTVSPECEQVILKVADQVKAKLANY